MSQTNTKPAFRRRFGDKWLLSYRSFIKVSPERRTVVLEDIAHGSTPTLTYYLLLGVSGLLAGFGLLLNSAAVVVGAMLVSPLMTPIFGIAVSLVTGDVTLLRRAIIAEFGGVALVLVMTMMLGAMPFSLEITPEMLARTRPNLLDLLVATLAGLAGCMAMLDERISPVLPGVAIATSLTPPLATSGLSLAFGAYQGSWGSFLLFFANFLAILIVAATLFSFSGLVASGTNQSKSMVVRRFLTPAIGLVAVSILLTHYLLGMIEHWQMVETTNRVIARELIDEPSTSIEQVIVDKQKNDGAVNVLAMLRTPQAISPEKVKAVEKALSDALQNPVHMFFRCSITYDITAAGSANLRARPDLNGTFTEQKLPENVRIVQTAEQVIRELDADLPQIELQDIRLVQFPSGPVVLVSITSPLNPLPEAITKVENMINDRIGSTHVKLLVRVENSMDFTDKGRLLLGQAHFEPISEEQAQMQQHIEDAARELLTDFKDIIVLSLDAAKLENEWQIRAEAIGPRMLSARDIARIEKELEKQARTPVKLTVLSRMEAAVTDTGYYSVWDLVRQNKSNPLSLIKK